MKIGEKGKKLLAVLLFASLFISVMPMGILAGDSSTSGTTGDCTWALNGTVLTISGNGAMDDYDEIEYMAPWGTAITKAIIENGVTNIGKCAFDECSDLESVSIPDSVVTIGHSAFLNCDKLESVTIPENVTTIETWAFMGCSNITEVTIPENVTEIGQEAFSCCDKITRFSVDDDNQYFSSDDAGALISTENNELIQYPVGSTATEYAIPDGIKSIASNAFSRCHNITSVRIPDGVESIGGSAFYNCDRLSDVNIPESVKKIYNNAFSYTKIYNDTANWEDDVLYISNFLIEAKRSIGGHYTIKDSTKGIADAAFSYCTSLTSVTIPDGITNLSTNMFAGCTALTEVILSNSVTNIGSWTFSGCTALKSITIPNSVVCIESCAFRDCTQLTEIELPRTVTTVGNLAFYNCDNLSKIWFAGTQNERNNIQVGGYNDIFISATWHYNSCPAGQAHVLTHFEGVNATCVDTGKKEYWSCEKCLGLFLDADGITAIAESELSVPIDPDGHKTTVVEAKDATHDADGNIRYYICLNCSSLFADAQAKCGIKAEDTVITKYGHDYGTTYVNDADNHWKACACGNIIEKNAHKYDEWIVTKEATAFEKGSREKLCSVCRYKITEDIPATTNTGTGSAGTGDNSNIVLWLFIVSGGALITLIAVKRKRTIERR